MVIALNSNSAVSLDCLSELKLLKKRTMAILNKIAKGLGIELFTASAESEKAESEKAESETALRAAQLMDSYGNSILRLAYSYLHSMSDAEDILQDTLIKYITTAPRLDSAAHEKAWLLRVAANLSKNKIDYNRVRAAEGLDELAERLQTEEREDLSFVWEAVKQLPEKYREVIHLFHYEGLQTADIARLLGRKEATVRSDLARGRQKLREVLKEAYDLE